MRKLLKFGLSLTLGIGVFLSFTPASLAKEPCKVVTIFTTEDISGGAVTQSGTVNVNNYKDIIFDVDLVDADNGVSNLDITWTSSATAAGQQRTRGGCSASGATLTCAPLTLKWDPVTNSSKNYSLQAPIDHAHMQITVTPTGHGASDTVSMEVRLCE